MPEMSSGRCVCLDRRSAFGARLEVVRGEVKVAMADTAKHGLDEHVILAERPSLQLHRLEITAGILRSKGSAHHWRLNCKARHSHRWQALGVYIFMPRQRSSRAAHLARHAQDLHGLILHFLDLIVIRQATIHLDNYSYCTSRGTKHTRIISMPPAAQSLSLLIW